MLGVRHGVGRPTADGLVSIDIALRPGPDRFLALQASAANHQGLPLHLCVCVRMRVLMHVRGVYVSMYMCDGAPCPPAETWG